MGTVDRLTTRDCGLPSLLLMENAGLNLYQVLKSHFGERLAGRSTVILCGKGNNGGDGLVLARQLARRESSPAVVLFCRPGQMRGDAAVQLKAYRKSGGEVVSVTSREEWKEVAPILGNCRILVDALLGTGLGRPVTGLLAQVVRDVNGSGSLVLAVDIPTGTPSDGIRPIGPSVRAHATVTFTAPKIAHILHREPETFGQIYVTPIGTPSQILDTPDHFLNLMMPARIRAVLPARKTFSHKGTFGHVAVIAGSRGKTGAGALASRAALRSGSGLVTGLAPDAVQPLMASFQPEIMTEGVPSTPAGTLASSGIDRILELLEGKDAAGLGPGLSTEKETVDVVRRLTREAEVPLVLDADALNAYAGQAHELVNLKGQPLVVTPHPGEFARLTEHSIPQISENGISIAREFARDRNLWLVLKGFRTLVASPDGQVYACPLGNPGMATAGSGDVLTGVITSFLGQNRAQARVSPSQTTDAVVSAVYLHSLAGDLAAQTRGMDSLAAGDIIDHLGAAFLQLRGPGVRRSGPVGNAD
jgi:NAD(P)H-hydrate epimerase